MVTDGSRGIGAAVALRLAEKGADVAVTYRNSAERAAEVVEQIKNIGRRALAVQADCAVPAAAEIDRTLAVNVRAPLMAAQAAVRHMERGGRVVNIGSNAATVAHLAGPDGRYVSGAEFAVDGGFTA